MSIIAYKCLTLKKHNTKENKCLEGEAERGANFLKRSTGLRGSRINNGFN